MSEVKTIKGWEYLRTISMNKMVHYPDYYERQRRNELKLIERPDEYAVDVYVPKGAL